MGCCREARDKSFRPARQSGVGAGNLRAGNVKTVPGRQPSVEGVKRTLLSARTFPREREPWQSHSGLPPGSALQRVLDGGFDQRDIRAFDILVSDEEAGGAGDREVLAENLHV